MRVAFANDHAAIEVRKDLVDWLRRAGHEVLDFGVAGSASVDYPDVAAPALHALVAGEVERVVLVCGSGIGMSIAANRVRGVRCALATDTWAAEMSRRHNDANCLALRAREQAPETNLDILQRFFETPFEGGRHVRRVEKIDHVSAIAAPQSQEVTHS